VCSLGQVRPAMVNPTMRSRAARRMASAVVAEHSIPGSGAVAGTACAGAGGVMSAATAGRYWQCWSSVGLNSRHVAWFWLSRTGSRAHREVIKRLGERFGVRTSGSSDP
jgi:hypothetical protein